MKEVLWRSMSLVLLNVVASIVNVETASADALYSTFGPGDSYGPVTYSIQRPYYDVSVLGQVSFPYFFQFSPTSTGTVTGIDIAISSPHSGTFDQLVLNASILSDHNDAIDIDGSVFSLLGASPYVIQEGPRIVSSSFFLPTVLTKGEKYWLMVSAYNSAYGASVGLHGTTSPVSTKVGLADRFSGFASIPSVVSYSGSSQIAFRVNGILSVPEPHSLVLFVSCICAIPRFSRIR